MSVGWRGILFTEGDRFTSIEPLFETNKQYYNRKTEESKAQEKRDLAAAKKYHAKEKARRASDFFLLAVGCTWTLSCRGRRRRRPAT